MTVIYDGMTYHAIFKKFFPSISADHFQISVPSRIMGSKPAVPSLFGPRAQFRGRQGVAWGKMAQAVTPAVGSDGEWQGRLRSLARRSPPAVRPSSGPPPGGWGPLAPGIISKTGETLTEM